MKRVARIIGVVLFIVMQSFAQEKPATQQQAGDCSINAVGSNNQLTINCPGMSKEQGQRILAILNKVLAGQLDPKAVMDKLDEIQQGMRAANLKAELTTFNGWLEPAGEPIPAHSCGTVPDDVMLLFLGNRGNVTEVNRFPHTVINVRGGRALQLDRSPAGLITPIIDIRSADNRIIVQMNSKDGFAVNQSNSLLMKRPDKSTLVVEDQYGNEVLNAHYINEHAFQLTGVMTIPGFGKVPLDFSRSLEGVCIAVSPNGGHFNNDIVLR